MPIVLANARYLAEEAMAEVLKPDTPEQLYRQVGDLQADLYEAHKVLWRTGGTEGRDWLRARHPQRAAHLARMDGGDGGRQ